jgi:hypothetical protein
MRLTFAPPITLIRRCQLVYPYVPVGSLTGLLHVTDLDILVVLITRLLRQDLDKLVNKIELIEP